MCVRIKGLGRALEAQKYNFVYLSIYIYVYCQAGLGQYRFKRVALHQMQPLRNDRRWSVASLC